MAGGKTCFYSEQRLFLITQEMEALLTEITQSQQRLLRTNLNEGRNSLLRANQQIVIAGVIALLLGIILSVAFRESIVSPIRRLTFVAEQIGKVIKCTSSD